MAKILEFRLSKLNHTACDVSGDRTSLRREAEIVIFPGVRYERWPDDGGPAARKPAIERDVLQFAD